MIEPLLDHLWQSTLCALAAALLTLAFWRNGAKVRFFIWLAASVKFLIPFSVFVWLGEYLRWETAPSFPTGSGFSVLGQIAEPAAVVTSNFAGTASGSATFQWGWNVWTLLLSIWLLGSLALLCFRLFQWLRLTAVVKAASPLQIDASIPVRETTSTLEPGIFGIYSPTLLMPAGITNHLAPAQLDAILAHELCHWRRRDNLTAAIHMLVEVLFWFHPLVWWLGGRLVVERERACDEAVIQSGSDRQAYAEGILKVCQHYVEPPLCAAGVSGGLLRKRIEDIMTNPILSKLPIAKRCLLSVAAFLAIAVPIALGLTGAPGVALAGDALDRRLYDAAEAGDVDGINKLLQGGARIDTVLRGDGSPLIAAARAGNLDAARLLLDKGADPNMAVPGDGSPLIAAAAQGRTAVAALLLQRGAQVDFIVPDDENALIRAAAEGHLEVVRLLVASGADVNARVRAQVRRESREEWRTPLTMARRGGHTAVVRFLLSAGAQE